MEDIVKDTTDNHALKEFGRCIKEDMRKCAEQQEVLIEGGRKRSRSGAAGHGEFNNNHNALLNLAML